MPRILKEPEVRKQEIIDTAMEIFRDKGYDATSIADIARAMNVVPGLCYRYFPSKQDIFEYAVKQYAVECSQEFIQIISDQEKTFKERIAAFAEIMINKDDKSKYSDFYHSPGNESFHLRLAIEMFKYMAPYISKELKKLTAKGEIHVDNPELMTEFLLYGQIALWKSLEEDGGSEDFKARMLQVRTYIYKLVGIC